MLYDIVEEVRERCGDLSSCIIGYGHVGDGICSICAIVVIYTSVFSGNLHMNVVTQTHSHQLHELLEPFVFDWTGQVTMTTH